MHNRLSQMLRLFVNEVLSGFNDKSLGKDIPTGNLRLGTQLTAKRNSNTLYDEAEDSLENANEFQAAMCLIISNDGKILCVSRGKGSNQVGLPGGRVESGESPIDAAIRELWEETGLTAIKPNLVFVSNDVNGCTVSTYACKAIGQIAPSDEGDVMWVDPGVLINDALCPFSHYNKKLFHQIGLVVKTTNE